MQPLPAELIAALRHARQLEVLAREDGGLETHARAMNATAAIALAAAHAGWRHQEIADVLGMTRAAVQKRIEQARRRYQGETPALVFDEALRGPAPQTRLQEPAETREWLTWQEAAAFAGVNRFTIRNWSGAGILPNTRSEAGRSLFLKADLRRVMSAERYHGRGVDYAKLRVEIAEAGL